MAGVLAYDPLRLAVARHQHAGRGGRVWPCVAGEEPMVADAVGIAHDIAAASTRRWCRSLRAVLSSTAMTEWNGVPALMTVDAADRRADRSSHRPIRPVRARRRRVLARRGDHARRTGPVVPRRQPGVRHVRRRRVQRRRLRRPTTAATSYPIVVCRVETDDGDVYTADEHPVAPASRASPRSAAVTPAGRSSAPRPGSPASRRSRRSPSRSLGALGGTTGQRRAVAAQQRLGLHRHAGRPDHRTSSTSRLRRVPSSAPPPDRRRRTLRTARRRRSPKAAPRSLSPSPRAA